MAPMLAGAANLLVRVLLEPACASCQAPLDAPLTSPVCAACWGAVRALTPPFCGCCGDVLPSWRAGGPLCARCRRQPPRFSIGRSAGRYEGSLRAVIHAFKYEGRRLLADPLAALMRRAGAEVLHGADAVVPVPLHPWRALDRGFNQADDLARHMGLPVWRPLRRCSHGPPQAGLPAARRHANVRKAFAPRSRAWMGLVGPRWTGILRGRTLVLIDDVMTTGATLDACSLALLAAGATSVRALTVARAVATRLPPSPPRRDLSPARHR